MKSNSEDSPSTSKSTSDQVREYKVWELQQLADRLLAAALPSGIILPIEIENVAYHLGLDINPVVGLRQNCDVIGTLYRDSQGQYWIVVDEYIMDCRENRYRFTVGEEVAHFLIHRDHIDRAQDIRGAIALQEKLSIRYRFFESNARRLAAELLMPRKNLRADLATAYAEVVRVAGFRNLEAVHAQVVDLLRRRYVVSTDAMRFQLETHGLRTHDTMAKAFGARSEHLQFPE